jgi:hypothetical protein
MRTYQQIYHDSCVDDIIDEFDSDIRKIAEQLLYLRRETQLNDDIYLANNINTSD